MTDFISALVSSGSLWSALQALITLWLLLTLVAALASSGRGQYDRGTFLLLCAIIIWLVWWRVDQQFGGL